MLSVYVGTDPRHDPNLQAAGIEVGNRFRELQERVAETTAADRRRDVAAALDRLHPAITALVSPPPVALGRVLFAALGTDWTLTLESALPVPNRVVLDDGPFIHPLLEVLDEGRPAGIVLVAAGQVRLLEWRLGSLRPLSQMQPDYTEAPHERAGQIGGGPAGQFNSPVREQRQAREQDRMQRFLGEVGGLAAQFAARRGWERTLVSGGPDWTEVTIAAFPTALRDGVCADPRVLSGLDDAELAVLINDWVHTQHREHEREILAEVRASSGTGRWALGLVEVAAALQAGRAARLVYDPNVRYAGYLGAGGALYGEDQPGPDGRPGRPDSRFTERLVERALRTGASVSPVEGVAGAELASADGIAALLRW